MGSYIPRKVLTRCETLVFHGMDGVADRAVVDLFLSCRRLSLYVLFRTDGHIQYMVEYDLIWLSLAKYVLMLLRTVALT